MEINNLKQEIEEAKKEHKKTLFIGDECDKRSGPHNAFALVYLTISLDKNIIEFTTDVPDYLKENLEKRLDKLYEKFKVIKVEILFHKNVGKEHDKNIRIFVGDKILTKVIIFILNNFYSFKDWTFSFEQNPKMKKQINSTLRDRLQKLNMDELAKLHKKLRLDEEYLFSEYECKGDYIMHIFEKDKISILKALKKINPKV